MAFKRRHRRKVVFRRKHPVMKAVAKAVVRSALAKAIERKHLLMDFTDLVVKPETFYVCNPIAPISKGTNEHERIGDKISNVRLQLGLCYWHLGSTYAQGTAPVYSGSTLRVIVFKSNLQLNPGVATWSAQLPNAGAFPKFFSQPLHPSSSPVNTHDYTILSDRRISSHRNFFTTYESFGTPAIHKMNVNLAKSFQYGDNTVNYGKTTNIYVMVVVSMVGATSADIAGRLQCDGYLTWTDA